MTRRAQRWFPLLLVLLMVVGATARHAAPVPHQGHRVVHAVSHVAVVPVHVFGALLDAAPSYAPGAPSLMLLLVVAAAGAMTVGTRRTPLIPARAPPGTRAADAS
jgi:hypothetical protein